MQIPVAAQRVQKLERIFGLLSDADKAALRYPLFQSTVQGAHLTFRGLTPGIEIKRIEENIQVHVIEEAETLRILRQAAQEQRRFQKIYDQGLLIDLPILAMTKAADMTTSELVEKIRNLRDHPPSTGQKAMWIGETSVELSITNGVITGMIVLGTDPFTRWTTKSVKVDATRLPKSVQAGLAGRPMRDIIDHPWIEGLTIRRASGDNVLTLHAVEGPVPAGAHDVLGWN